MHEPLPAASPSAAGTSPIPHRPPAATHHTHTHSPCGRPVPTRIPPAACAAQGDVRMAWDGWRLGEGGGLGGSEAGCGQIKNRWASLREADEPGHASNRHRRGSHSLEHRYGCRVSHEEARGGVRACRGAWRGSGGRLVTQKRGNHPWSPAQHTHTAASTPMLEPRPTVQTTQAPCTATSLGCGDSNPVARRRNPRLAHRW